MKAEVLCDRALMAGDLDITFDGDGKVTMDFGNSYDDVAQSVAIQSDGKIVVAGSSWNGSNSDFALTRYNSNGSLDTTFDGDGKVTTAVGRSNDDGNSVAIQSDGKIVVAGSSNGDFALARYNSDGSLDTTFDGDGTVTTDFGSGSWACSVAIQSDGKIVVAGNSYKGGNGTTVFALARYNSNGSLDTTFDGDGKVTTDFGNSYDVARSVAIQSDGKIVVAGYSYNGSNTVFALSRYNSNGSLDTTFDGDGTVTTAVGRTTDGASSLAIQSDGKIVVAGYSDNGSNIVFALTRYNSNGSLDTTFDGDGKVTTAVGRSNDGAQSVAIQSDGKIVVAGYSYNGSNYDFALTRYKSNGGLDTNFDGDGKVTTAVGSSYDIASSVAIQSDGKIVVAGYSDNGSNHDFALTRYNADFNQNPTDISLSWAVSLYKVTDLGTLGGVGVDAHGINNDGQVVGLSSTAAGDFRAFSCIDGPMLNLGTLGGTHSEARGVNNSGQVVGYSTAANGSDRAFLYSGGVMQDIGTLGGSSSRAFSINSSGQIVGYSQTGTGGHGREGHAFLYTGGTMQDLGTLGGSGSRAYSVNDSGQVVGESSTESYSPRAFLYSDGSMQDLGTINGPHSIARAINNSGQVVGSSTVRGGQYWHAFLYENGSMQDLGTLGGTTSHANDINNFGQVVGQAEASGTNGGPYAFLYSGGSMHNLQDLIAPGSGWHLVEARGINDNGLIVGFGQLDGHSGARAFLLTPVVPTSIAENAGINTTVGTLRTTDPNSGDTFTYALVTGNGDTDNASFNINGSSLRATDSFNFEAKSIYTVRVRSTDQGGLFTEKAFTISVTDVNEAPTDITLSSASIAENAGANATVGTLSSTDPDAGNTFTYTLVAGTGDTDNGAFSISGSTLRATNTFDFETKSSYTIRVRSTDQEGLFTDKTFTISVTNVNETPTDIGLSSSRIAENAGANAVVGALSTIDPDSGNTFAYSLVTGDWDADNGAFNISGNSLRATGSFDFETKSSYTIRIRSTDQNGLSIEKAFVITVTNTNESPNDIRFSSSGPLIDFVINGSIESPAVLTETQFFNGQNIGSGWTVISGNTAYVIRNAANLGTSPFGTQFLEIHGDTVGQLLSGLIPGRTYTLSYYVTLSTTSSYFGNGRITASIAGQSDIFDYSLFGNHLFGSAAFPWTKRSLSFTATSSSELLLISGAGAFNQNPFVAIDNVSVIASIPENMGANAPIGVLESTDPDNGSSVIYSLVAGEDDADNTQFIIDGSTLRSIANLDFESKSRFTIRVRATDQGGLFTEESFTIHLTNVNEEPADINLSATSIPENSDASAIVRTLSTLDVDAGNTFVYSLVTGAGDADNASFRVVGSDLVAISTIDFETKSSYTIRVRSTDQGGLFVENTFVITVIDVNEAPTDIALSSSTIDENAGANAVVGTLSTADVDAGNTFIYSLVAGSGDTDNAAFHVSGSTLRATSSFDFETRSDYTVRVRSTDQGGLFVEKVFAIRVVNVNDAPVAVGNSYWISVSTPQMLDVLANDSDVDSLIDPTSIEIVQPPVHGTATPLPDGTVRYTPNAGYRGAESFTYRVRDSLGLLSNSATVQLRVNSAPKTTPDSLVVKQTITTVLDVLRNDSDPDGTLDPATLVIVNESDVVDLAVQPNGTIRFTPREGFLGTTQFRYVISDNEGRPSVPTDVTVLVVVSVYQNPRNRFDVDDDGAVSPLDVLVLINLLNSTGPSVPVDGLSDPPPYVDVTADNRVDPLDVLAVINHINSRGNGEGEGNADRTFDDVFASDDWQEELRKTNRLRLTRF